RSGRLRCLSWGRGRHGRKDLRIRVRWAFINWVPSWLWRLRWVSIHWATWRRPRAYARRDPWSTRARTPSFNVFNVIADRAIKVFVFIVEVLASFFAIEQLLDACAHKVGSLAHCNSSNTQSTIDND